MDGLIGARADAGARGALAAREGLVFSARPRWRFDLVCRGRDGNVKWAETIENLVTTEGKNHLLSVAFKSGTQITSWFVGLISGSSPTLAAADTMASHAGWTEFQDYGEAARQALTLGTVSGGSVDNSAAKATFTINATGTVGGAFVVSNSTKGGTTGTLYGEAAFGTARSVAASDTIDVTATLTV